MRLFSPWHASALMPIRKSSPLGWRLLLSSSSFHVHRARHNKLRDFFCDPVGGWHQCTTEMNIALRDAAGSMPKQSGYHQFCEAEFRCDARKRMPQDVRRDVLKICLGADSIQNSHYADEVAITAIGRKEKRRLLADRLRFQEIDRRLTDDANLPARLGIGEANAVPLGPHPLPLHAEHLHPSEPRQQDRADGCKRSDVIPLVPSPPWSFQAEQVHLGSDADNALAKELFDFLLICAWQRLSQRR